MTRPMNLALVLAVTAALCAAAVCDAQEPELPKPAPEHQRLSQFAGEWEVTAETVDLVTGEHVDVIAIQR